LTGTPLAMMLLINNTSGLIGLNYW